MQEFSFSKKKLGIKNQVLELPLVKGFRAVEDFRADTIIVFIYQSNINISGFKFLGCLFKVDYETLRYHIKNRIDIIILNFLYQGNSTKETFLKY